MTNGKIDLALLPDFNPAYFLADHEDIKAYIRLVKEEGDPAALGQALKTIFMALGACHIAEALNLDTSCVWDAQEEPLEHPETLQQITELIESGALVENTVNPQRGDDFEQFLKAEGIYSDANARALRRVIAALLKKRSP